MRASGITTVTDVKNKPRGRPPAFDRDTVLDAAMRVFWSAGYEGASLPALTQAMGISAQSLYAAFGSKEALYRAAIDRYLTSIGGFGRKALSAEPDVIEAVRRLLNEAAQHFSGATDTPGCMITSAPSGSGDAALVGYGRDLRRAGLLAVVARLERGVSDGQLPPDIDCKAWARFITGVVQGMSVQARDGAVLADLRGIAAAAMPAIIAMQHGPQ